MSGPRTRSKKLEEETKLSTNTGADVTESNSPPRVYQRRKSSVGNIDLGDTSVPSFQTMHSNKSFNKDENLRKKQFNQTSKGDDLDVLKKLWLSIKILSIRHTWLPPLTILIFLRAMYIISNNYTPSNPLFRFINISYEIEGTNPVMYGKGLNDITYVLHSIIFFTFFREFLMQVVLKPLAIKGGLKNKNKIQRFMEQTYVICYCTLSGLLGLYIMKQTPLWYFETRPFYENYPHKTHEYLFKFFYLNQAGFWGQQAVVLLLQLEKPRKDYFELVFHHIVTILLIGLSYKFHFTWIGLEIYITMDISDWFLAMSKTLSYLDSSFVIPFFVLFLSVWTYLRHWTNLRILWSVLTEFRTVGPWELSFPNQQYKCWISQPIVFTLIFALQLVNLYWLYLILRIAYRIATNQEAKDDRSDTEEEEEEDKEQEQETKKEAKNKKN